MRMLFTAFLIVAMIFLGLKFVPVYYDNYSFKDFVDDESKRASYATTMSSETIRNEVYKKAQEMDLPIEKEAIKVVKNGAAGGVNPVSISANYDVHLDLLVTATDLHFTVGAANTPPQ